MSESLVERLRDPYRHLVRSDREEAADRISELEEDLAEANQLIEEYVRSKETYLAELEAEVERLRIGISITDLRLTRIGDEAHVEVRIGGIWFRAITEQVDDSFDHIVSASCIRDIVRKAFPETVRAMGAALSPSDKADAK